MHEEWRPGWVNLPMLAGAACLVVGSVLLWAQLVLSAIVPGKQMKLCARVYGVVRPPYAAFTVDNVLKGTWQRALGVRIGYSEPYFPLAVRVRNQVEYSLLGVPASPNVIIGAHQQLISTNFIDDYCNRDIRKFMVGAPNWAIKIRWMQDNVEARGKTFLYVLTPSKISQYPSVLPRNFPCPSSETDRVGLVPAWMHLVDKAGIHAVNTSQILRAARNKYPFPFFPQGGIHWNWVGSALGAQSVEANLEAQRGDGVFKPFTFVWKMSSSPGGSDADLASILNLVMVPTHFEVPLVTMYQALKPVNCNTIRVVVVGGSFMEHIGQMLSELPCGVHVTEYFYWQTHLTISDNGIQRIEQVNSARRDEDLKHADVIIYEENEFLLGRSLAGVQLYRWLIAHSGS